MLPIQRDGLVLPRVSSLLLQDAPLPPHGGDLVGCAAAARIEALREDTLLTVMQMFCGTGGFRKVREAFEYAPWYCGFGLWVSIVFC